MSVGQTASDILPVISGVPQGSILGPLLFLIHINDLPDKLSLSKVLLFADDTKCFLPISSRADCLSLQHDLSLLANWSSSWKLTFNENKCSVVHFIRGQSSAILSYSVNNTIISTAGSQKDLGVIIMSSDMQWKIGDLTTFLSCQELTECEFSCHPQMFTPNVVSTYHSSVLNSYTAHPCGVHNIW